MEHATKEFKLMRGKPQLQIILDFCNYKYPMFLEFLFPYYCCLIDLPECIHLFEFSLSLPPAKLTTICANDIREL